jgi:hypothetical protein
MTLSHPKSFISHSSVDKELAERIARDLIRQGIDAWFSKWEIMPGDSLRRKIDHGISEATHFIVLLTQHSLKSEWVQTELDAAMVRKIENECRLLPVLIDIPFEAVPLTLRGLLCVKLDDYDNGLEQLIDACYGRSQKPLLGQSQLPKVIDTLRMSENAQKIVMILNSKSKTGTEHDPIVSLDEITRTALLTNDLAEEAVDELKDAGYVDVIRAMNAPLRVFPRNLLFWETDPVLQQWIPSDDARILASEMVNGNGDGANLAELDKKLKWGPRRINPAATSLVARELAQAPKIMGTHPYAYAWLRVTTKTRRMLRDG